jgi:hypothetical protein
MDTDKLTEISRVAEPDPFRVCMIFPDPFLIVLGSGSYSNEHDKINRKGKFNNGCLLFDSWLADLLTRKIS